MNDEFLHRLRKEPPPAFARRLQARLSTQEPERAPPARSRMLRNVLLAFVIAGSAYAGAYMALNRRPVAREGLNVSRPASDSQQNTFVTSQRPASTPSAAGERVEFPFAEQGTAKVQAPSSSGDRAPGVQENSFVVAPASRSTSGRQSSVPIPAMPGVSGARETVRIVAAKPAVAIANRFASWFGNPQIERFDSGQDFQAFCKGVGLQYPDVDVAVRRISKAEFSSCQQNGVDRLIELKLGYQAMVVARTTVGGPLELSPRDIFLALAKQVPDPADRSRLIDNPNRTWNQVNPQLEYQYIEVYGPALGTPLRTDFSGILMEAGCNAFPSIAALQSTDALRHYAVCHTLRQDGAYIETEQTSELVPQKLGANPNAVAVMTYEFYKRNQDALIGNVLGGVEPAPESIGAGTFPGSRTLYLYLKKAHLSLVPSMRRFMTEGMTERITGPGGLLARDGLIPVSEPDRQQNREIARELRELKLP